VKPVGSKKHGQEVDAKQHTELTHQRRARALVEVWGEEEQGGCRERARFGSVAA
jgi:hypothetical protein